jgi:hypothetical protein
MGAGLRRDRADGAVLRRAVVTLRDPAQLLSAWEAAAGLPQPARGVAVLEAAGLVEDLDAALDLPISDAAALAIGVQAEAFGAIVDGVLDCEACGLELDVVVPLLEFGAAGGATARVGDLAVRAPTTRDLLEAQDGEELLERCVGVQAASLDGELRAAVEAAAEELAGPAGVVVRAECPECGAIVSAPLDPGALLWERVAAAVPAALAEVAELASAFGWSETEVLGLSPRRRQAYLELVRGGR